MTQVSEPKLFGAPGKPGVALMTGIRDVLKAAGLPRTSTLTGGELTGLLEPNYGGSTGFSVKIVGADRLLFHIVISGKPHLRYERTGDDEREPVEPESLAPRITRVFGSMGYKVFDVKCTGWQLSWDDDVDYEVTTNYPASLGHDPATTRRYLLVRLRDVERKQAHWTKEIAYANKGLREASAEATELREAINAL
jgi:hypothetical protein